MRACFSCGSRAPLWPWRADVSRADFPRADVSRGVLSCGAQALGTWAQQLDHTGFDAPWQVESSWTRGQTCVPCTGKRILIPGPPGKSLICCVCCSVTKSYLSLCNPMDCSAPGFPILRYLLEFAQVPAH